MNMNWNIQYMTLYRWILIANHWKCSYWPIITLLFLLCVDIRQRHHQSDLLLISVSIWSQGGFDACWLVLLPGHMGWECYSNIYGNVRYGWIYAQSTGQVPWVPEAFLGRFPVSRLYYDLCVASTSDWRDKKKKTSGTQGTGQGFSTRRGKGCANQDES